MKDFNCRNDLCSLKLMILLWMVIIFQPVFSHGLRYHEFRPIDHRIGMNASAVNCFFQDNQGLIWLGTDRGLYSFDGYQARHYSASLQTQQESDPVIYCAQMIDSLHIWLGTDIGLLVFNTYTDNYEEAPKGFPANIRSIARINENTFWIGSIHGLFIYNKASRKIVKINDALLPNPAIYAILRYDDNTFYFGTYNGLCRYDTRNQRFDKIAMSAGSQTSNQLILSLLADYDQGCIWVGYEGGLSKYNTTLHTFSAEPLFNGNSVKSLLLDNTRCLWAGTDNGLYVFEPVSRKHRIIRHDALNDRSILNNMIWSVFTDEEQNIWVGTDAGASLYVYNNQFNIRSISELAGSSEGNQIISLLSDSHGNLWLGGTNGIIRVDRTHGTTVWYQQNSKAFPLPHNKVRYVFEDAEGDVWIATDGSICRYNNTTSQFDRYQIEDINHTRNANWSYAICQDETRKLWIATCLGGLFVVDKKQLLNSGGRPFIAEKNYFANSSIQGLSGNMLQFLAMDDNHNIWTGTYRAGICMIDRMNQKVIQFKAGITENALPADDVTAMIRDAENYIWVALRNQVARIDPQKGTIRMIVSERLNDAYINGMTDDGLRIWMSSPSGLFFIDKSSLKLMQLNSGGNYYSSVFFDRKTGHILAGGINQYVEFDPVLVLSDDHRYNMYLTSLSVNDKIVQTNSSEEFPMKLDQSIRFASSIKLPHNYNNLSFTFSDVTYNQQQNMQYASKLEGFDADWHFAARGNNLLTYNNLPPGDYELKISRIGIDGNPLPNPLSFSVRILHPWYSTTAARIFYVLLLILLVIAFVNYYLVLNRLRYERIEKSKTRELTAHKIDFLTNISHELKTPLSLIIGPLGKIIDQVKPQGLKNELADVRQNAMKMGSLIHQMMEASRQEFDGFGLIVSKVDLISFTQSVVSVFEKALAGRSVKISLQYDMPVLYLEADLFKLEVILNNILSNASKFSPDNSIISISIQSAGDFVKIVVTDEGPGIDAQDLPHVMDRFFQSRHSLPQNKEGSGVGLSIVKEYVQLHRGTIQVISDGRKGTAVEITIPVRHIVGDTPLPGIMKEEKLQLSGTKPLLLVVEDNVEILTFITRSLAGEFRCISAQNGKSGFDMATSNHPDIIVTDIMMPVMDGIEMCRKLKENIATSLIPVVMLTARDDKTTELTGYSTGADAFILKPFEIGYLSDRLHHVLKGRNLLVTKARQEAIIQPKDEELLSTNEKFLTTITQIVEQEIANPGLNVNVLSEKSGYSLKQIYRRIKSLTGQTAVDYIRTVRLKKAATLLSRKTFTVAEVMYMVGFSNHSYFSKRFQEKYGKTPRQFVDDELKNA